MYAINNKQSFDNVEKWLNEIRASADPNICIMLVGNKSDLATQRQVATEDAKAFAQRNKLAFAETSAANASNVESAFNELVAAIFHGLSAPTSAGTAPSTVVTATEKPSTINLNQPPPKPATSQTSSGCNC